MASGNSILPFQRRCRRFLRHPAVLGRTLASLPLQLASGPKIRGRLPRFWCDWSGLNMLTKRDGGLQLSSLIHFHCHGICENDGHPKLWLGGLICFLVLVFHPYLGNESIWTIFSNGLKPPARWCHVRVMSCLVSTVYAGCDRWVFALFGASRKIGWRITLGWWTNNTLWRDQGMCLCGGLILPTSSSMIRE